MKYSIKKRKFRCIRKSKRIEIGSKRVRLRKKTRYRRFSSEQKKLEEPITKTIEDTSEN